MHAGGVDGLWAHPDLARRRVTFEERGDSRELQLLERMAENRCGVRLGWALRAGREDVAAHLRGKYP